jgi:hypothetical protein
MLTKDRIEEIIKAIDFPSDKYWVSSGAGLVLHGVKEATNDVDLGCTLELWSYLLTKGYTPEEKNPDILIINPLMEVVKDWYVDDIEYLDGIPVASLQSIKKQKLALGREKDFKDIGLIDEYFIKNSSVK